MRGKGEVRKHVGNRDKVILKQRAAFPFLPKGTEKNLPIGFDKYLTLFTLHPFVFYQYFRCLWEVLVLFIIFFSQDDCILYNVVTLIIIMVAKLIR